MKASETFVRNTEWQKMAEGVKRTILGYDSEIMMVAVQFEAGAVGALHDHPHRQVTYVAAGEFDVTIDGRTESLRAGESFFVAPNLRHGVTAKTAGTLIDVFTPAREDFIK
ncbi:MAG TPA: cupin domain-containing protein [Longimicrobiales bacterium]|nr:cupin domain-containing protein [Longimicrobiales bacterium]